jgi:hypothetical protein
MTARKRHRGFNLIEAAVVLGVVGLVIGGIWYAAASLQRDARRQDIQTMLGKIAQRYIEVYSGFEHSGFCPWPQNNPIDSLFPDEQLYYKTAIPGNYINARCVQYFIRRPTGIYFGVVLNAGNIPRGVGYAFGPLDYADCYWFVSNITSVTPRSVLSSVFEKSSLVTDFYVTNSAVDAQGRFQATQAQLKTFAASNCIAQDNFINLRLPEP